MENSYRMGHGVTDFVSESQSRKLSDSDNSKAPLNLVSERRQHESKEKLELSIDDDKFNIQHFFTGNNTIREVYEDFLTRTLEHS